MPPYTRCQPAMSRFPTKRSTWGAWIRSEWARLCRRRWHACVAGVGLSLVLASLACTVPDFPTKETATTATGHDPAAGEALVTSSPPAGFQVGSVRAGRIAESLTFRGRVTDSSEQGLSVPVAARVAALHLDHGQRPASGRQG